MRSFYEKYYEHPYDKAVSRSKHYKRMQKYVMRLKMNSLK